MGPQVQVLSPRPKKNISSKDMFSFFVCNISYKGDSMYYIAHFVKRTKLFQKPYIIEGENIIITDTNRAKKKFLNSNIKNVLFREHIKSDSVLGQFLVSAKRKDRTFELKYLQEMIKHTIQFLKLPLPINEIAVFSPFAEEIFPVLIPYAKMITLVGEKGEQTVTDGVNIRRIKRVKTIPDFVIEDSKRGVSPIFNVPGVHIGEGESNSRKILSAETLSFKTSVLKEEVNTDTLLFLLEKEGDFEYTLTSFTKKCPTFLTFG